jgi:citron Rho-interacting kinase
VPPFIPTITSNDDTSNFDEFEPKKKPVLDKLSKSNDGFSGKDLPFVGFTFTKGLFEAESRTLSQDVTGTSNSVNSLERKLTLRSKELSETRHRVQQMQLKQVLE